MNVNNLIPHDQIIASIVSSMTKEEVLSVKQMLTGDQNFVYAVDTQTENYVLRVTGSIFKHKFYAALAWQEKLLPLGVPLAKFIQSDLEGLYSPFPALLMKRLPGDDLINIYSELTKADKKNLAHEMIKIQALCLKLPLGSGYGILDSYESTATENTWYEFLAKRLEFCKEQLSKAAVFDTNLVEQALNIAKAMKENLTKIQPIPFLWDASERNVLIHEGKISGIVDVDELCFGDPLLVIALTSTCLELEGFDTVYTDEWAAGLELDTAEQTRLNFYKLFYAIAFMRKHGMQTVNKKRIEFNVDRLLNIFHHSLERLKG